jgi:alpha-glucoside transport system substrate-binding protein
MENLIGKSLGRYHILEQLGEGGMAVVYKAYDTRLEREVAVKVIRTEKLTLETMDKSLKRFAREAKALARLTHPNIIPISDYGEEEGVPFLVMDYIPGGTLKEKLRGNLAMDWQEAIKLLMPIARALDYAHQQKIIHRDIKPSNILITASGEPMLTDFGIAKIIEIEETADLTGTSLGVGTPEYMAPEQVTAKIVDHRADIYALGVVFYEMVTGRKPFQADTPMAVLFKHASDPLPRPTQFVPKLPKEIEQVLLKVLAKDPANRYQSMTEFANALANPDLATLKMPGKQRGRWPNIFLTKVIKPQEKKLLYIIGAIVLFFAVFLLTSFPEPEITEVLVEVTSPAIATEKVEVTPPAIATEKEEISDINPGDELAVAYAGEYDGKVVTMSGSFSDTDAVKFDNSVAAFEEATGIDIKYEGLKEKEFEASIAIRVDGGNAPDIVDFTQPSLLSTIVAKGQVVDLNGVIDNDWLAQNYIQSWLDMGTMEGPDGPMMAGVWARANSKSLVFYPKAEFDAAGYEIPTTWDEMMTLTETIASDGDTPWCIGIESGAATGWVMTDWLEDTMLRTTSLENYDKWVAGELPFNSPEVQTALGYVTDIWFNDAYIYGGQASIPTTFFGDAPTPMFESPPKCWLHRQGNWITSFFPEGKEAGVDYDFFYLPPINVEYGKPVMGAGDIYAMFNDRPEVRAAIQYFSTGDSVKGWVETGGVISPHNDSDLDWYADSVTRGVAEIILKADSFRFDASDLMPEKVGFGTFWKYMTDYVSGTVEMEDALQKIDDSWPTK